MLETSQSREVNDASPFQMPKQRQCPFDPPRELAELRASAPLSRFQFLDGRVGWLVTSHELARAVMGDQRFSRGASGSPLSAAENQAAMVFDAIEHNNDNFPEAARACVQRYNSEGRLPEALWDPVLVQALHEH